MPRRLKLLPREIGELQLYLIYETDGVYESYWRPLQGHEVTTLFTRIPQDVLDHALHGYTSPLVKALGIPPVGALRKLPPAARQCVNHGRCSLYVARDCVPTAAAMPWCFEPGGSEDEQVRKLGAEAIGLWREGVYILVIS